MTDLCGQDVVVQITPITPQILTTSGTAATAPGGAALGRHGAGGAGELGRRLLAAARAGDTPLVLELMAQGAAFTADWLGTSPLHAAAAGAHADTCAVLLRAGVSRDCRTKVERTALHEAAAAGHARVASLLLANGAAPDAADMLRMTPLHWAAERGHAAVVRVLLRHGADPALRSKFLLTPRELAARRRHAEVLRLLDEAEAEARRAPPAAPPSREEQTTSPSEPQNRRTQRVTYSAQHSTEPIKIKVEKSEAGGAGGAALLRAHGITLLPPDAGSTVLSALQSGRSVVLSDAGKLMLKESVSSVNKVLPTASPVAPATAPSRGNVVLSAAPGTPVAPATPLAPAPGGRGVVLTATPVRETPRGVKVFTLNNKSLAMPKENKTPVKKVVNPQDMQIKLVQVGGGAGGDGRLASPLKAKRGAAVKIIMHKANFDKMVAASSPPAPEAAPDESAAATAQRTISALAAELRAARDELQQTRDELQQTRDELYRTQEQLRQYRPDDSL